MLKYIKVKGATMKKSIWFLFFILIFSFLFACKPKGNQSDIGSESGLTSESKAHVHDCVAILAVEPTCSKFGNIEYYYCKRCKKNYSDKNATVELTDNQVRVEKVPHRGEKQPKIESTCSEVGVNEHYKCTVCQSTFFDLACTVPMVGNDLIIPKKAHALEYVAETPSSQDKNGYKEHWQCLNCFDLFLDENGEFQVKIDDLVIYTLMNLPDFIVDVEKDKDPVILQLTDTQIIDGSQSRPNHSSGDKITYAPEKFAMYCYDYLTEIINATKPDLIIMTGDLIYGAYDDNGSLLQSLISFMDSFNIPWAPVFGNHDNESAMGADWQCEQLENSKNCLFKQRELTGNGNYTVAIRQNGKLTRIFYMLDSNGCTNASSESLMNGQTSKSVGFADDQVEWYTKHIGVLKELSPATKISFAYHIQQAVFGEALEKYGFDQNQKYHDIFLDYLSDKTAGDFGYVGRQMKDGWDESKRLFKQMKSLGVDSIFVGHEHCNSASVVYEGIRLQYGQKSSQYDRYNSIGSNGKITPSAIYENNGKTPIVGGSVVVLSKADGAISNAYIYYCKNAGGNIDFDKYY